MYKQIFIAGLLFWKISLLSAQEKALELLPGTWISESDSSMREIWEDIPEGFNGRSVKINAEGEEEIWEELRIYRDGETLIYEADVKEDQGAIKFHLVQKSKDELLFTNPQHDFPRFIHYHWKDPDHLKVEVYSRKGGKKLEFHFYRGGDWGKSGN